MTAKVQEIIIPPTIHIALIINPTSELEKKVELIPADSCNII